MSHDDFTKLRVVTRAVLRKTKPVEREVEST